MGKPPKCERGRERKKKKKDMDTCYDAKALVTRKVNQLASKTKLITTQLMNIKEHGRRHVMSL